MLYDLCRPLDPKKEITLGKDVRYQIRYRSSLDFSADVSRSAVVLLYCRKHHLDYNTQTV
jgi:hypothetical protein